MTESYSTGETIAISIDFGEHPDAPGQVFDVAADAATVTLQHSVEHDQRHEFDDSGAVDLQGQRLVLELPAGTLERSGRWVYQGKVSLKDGRTLVWPREPGRFEAVEAIV